LIEVFHPHEWEDGRGAGVCQPGAVTARRVFDDDDDDDDDD